MPLSTEATASSAASQPIDDTSLTETLTNEHGKVFYEATYDVRDQQVTLVRETWYDDSLRALNEPGDASADQTSEPQPRNPVVAMEATRLVWQIIKDGLPVANTEDTKSSVLSASDPDSMNYANAKSGSSTSFWWKIYNTLTGTVYVEIDLKAQGYLHGQPISTSPAPKGFYLPSVYFNVTKCEVSWACSATGYANLENPVNVGSEHEAVAEIAMHGKLSASLLFKSWSMTVGFVANGQNGFRCVGSE